MSSNDKISYVVCCELYPDRAHRSSLITLCTTTDKVKADKIINDLTIMHHNFAQILTYTSNHTFLDLIESLSAEFIYLKDIYPDDGSEGQPDLVPLTDGEFFWTQEIPTL